MPKKGEPLSEKQVEAIGNWVKQHSSLTAQAKAKRGDADEDSFAVEVDVVSGPAQDAPSEDQSVPALVENPSDGPKNTSRSKVSRSGIWSMISAGDQSATMIAGIALLAILAWLFLKGLSKKSNNELDEPWLGRSPRSVGWTLLGLFNTLLFLGIIYYNDRCNRLELENLRLQSKTRNASVSIPEPTIVSADNLPLPPYPMHPRRLGGTYFRGNDERDETLFNGGFYRTATIELHLVDSSGTRLGWSDDLGAAPSIEITIERAPKATRELFTERVLKSISIEHFCQSDSSIQDSLSFEVVEKEQTWKALVPLPDAKRWLDGRIQGMVYLMYGIQPGDPPTPRPHFGIRYDLKTSEMKIDKSSELWMGSLYTLGGRVLVPNEKQVLLDRWFDWRPIPVIDGEASNDAELLGLPEHAIDKTN